MTVALTEEGHIESPFVRALTVTIRDHTAMNALLTDLGEHFGEAVEAEEQ